MFKIRLLKFHLFLVVVLSLLLLFTENVHAIDHKFNIRDEGFNAKFVSQSVADPVEMVAGEEKTVVFKFKNVGNKTWNSSTSNYISAYTVEEKYRESIFASSDWLSKKQTAKINGKVLPGEIGELELKLKAPEKTGEYIERFHLASENYSWVKGGYFYVKINVVVGTGSDPSLQVNKKVEESIEVENLQNKYLGKKVIQNKNEVKAVGGEKIEMVVIYKNTGEKEWSNYSLLAGSGTLAGTTLSFADNSWESGSTVFKKNKQVKKDEVLRETFYFRAPKNKGLYTVNFNLATEDEIMSGTEVNLTVDVTANAPEHYVEPNFNDSVSAKIENLRLEQEPKIRVGLWKPEEDGIDTVRFVSKDENYVVYKSGERMGILNKGQEAGFNFNQGVYSFKGGDLSFESADFIRLEPENNSHAVFELINQDRKVSWKGKSNFNKYRGAVEYRQTDDKTKIYIINELLFEDYVAGIGETSNSAPIEYIKALLTAARTYAYYITEHSDKYPGYNFDVVAHTGDQLYLGYESEVLMPRVVSATKDTRGFMITYDVDENKNTQNNIVITPYFANTAGRTLSWEEKWRGYKPWLVSVSAEYDRGKAMYGHGVGMSARDCAYRAEEEGLSWQELVKYYYTGVEVERIYR